eukprot:TRINITY_DN2573_c0_g1_i1.p1 TRINITY_DN2573_c0_g1~~TRINITY_DN2573_c0_g1_i1.p1  ORF type:complete len:532 (-),score=138.94 TRINITY_DN2573_c0_g1_i1:64-1659(-)
MSMEGQQHQQQPLLHPEPDDDQIIQPGEFESLDNAKFSSAHLKAIWVAGSGFLVDSYDNFVIGLMVPMIAYEYYNKSGLPSSSADGWLKAASSWGNMTGQIVFAILGDVLGRKKMYGVELIILIGGALLCALAAWPVGSDASPVTMLIVWRYILGIGIGGDYPVSAVIASEFASSQRRGQMIAAVFAMQGVGIILGSLVSLAVLACFKDMILEDVTNLGYCWRILAGFGAVPALLAVYWRLTIAESPRFAAHVLNDQERAQHAAELFLDPGANLADVRNLDRSSGLSSISLGQYFRFAANYFSQWSHAKILIGTALAWFFLDIGFYGCSLNTSSILGYIGFNDPTSKGNQHAFDDVWNKTVGQVVINMLGTVPGYWFTVALIEKTGRKPIQYVGFATLTVCFLILAVLFNDLKGSAAGHTGFVVVYTVAQFFFNFGPNATTFIIPAEIFPTAVRSTGHGLSAASGKIGAILGAQVFSDIAKKHGFQPMLYVFTACCFLGFLVSFLIPETKGRTLEQLSEDQLSLEREAVPA